MFPKDLFGNMGFTKLGWYYSLILSGHDLLAKTVCVLLCGDPWNQGSHFNLECLKIGGRGFLGAKQTGRMGRETHNLRPPTGSLNFKADDKFRPYRSISHPHSQNLLLFCMVPWDRKSMAYSRQRSNKMCLVHCLVLGCSEFSA